MSVRRRWAPVRAPYQVHYDDDDDDDDDDEVDPLTFIYEVDPYSPEICQICKIWTSYVKTFESFRLTDREIDRHMTEIIYHAALQVPGNTRKSREVSAAARVAYLA